MLANHIPLERILNMMIGIIGSERNLKDRIL
jgi:hypothetical protein